MFPATLTGLRYSSWRLPNVAATRQRWAGGHNRFAVLSTHNFVRKTGLEESTATRLHPSFSKNQLSFTINPSRETLQSKISAPSSAASARSTSGFRLGSHRKAMQPPPPAPQI